MLGSMCFHACVELKSICGKVVIVVFASIAEEGWEAFIPSLSSI